MNHLFNQMEEDWFPGLVRGLATLAKRLTSLRALAYASEVGESLRPLVKPSVVRYLYGFSWLYVATDVTMKTVALHHMGRNEMIKEAVDKSMWHSLASILLPAVTIHSVVRTTGHMLPVAMKSTRMGLAIPTLVGLASIPFIIPTIDNMTDWFMNNTYRRLVKRSKDTSSLVELVEEQDEQEKKST